MDEAELQEILDDAAARLALGRYSNADASVHALVAEVRRLTAALATARREGAEEMRAAILFGPHHLMLSAYQEGRIAEIALPLDAPGGAT